jgi:hypothetical protein
MPTTLLSCNCVKTSVVVVCFLIRIPDQELPLLPLQMEVREGEHIGCLYRAALVYGCPTRRRRFHPFFCGDGTTMWFKDRTLYSCSLSSPLLLSLHFLFIFTYPFVRSPHPLLHCRSFLTISLSALCFIRSRNISYHASLLSSAAT